MTLQKAISRIIQLRGNKLTKRERWKLSKRWLKGSDPASITFQGVSLNHEGFDAVVTTDGFKNLYIGIPGAFRVWLSLDGTYTIDVPNEAAVEVKSVNP